MCYYILEVSVVLLDSSSQSIHWVKKVEKSIEGITQSLKEKESTPQRFKHAVQLIVV